MANGWGASQRLWLEVVRYASAPLLGGVLLAWALWPSTSASAQWRGGFPVGHAVRWQHRLRLAVLVLACAPVIGVIFARRRGSRAGRRRRWAAWLHQAWVPPVSVGVVSVGVSLVVGQYGHRGFTDRVVDELAYRFQARTFALGRWVNPAHPAPEFFQCPQIIHHEVWASKYFPGHALALVPGLWLGAIHLVPILSGALSSALVYVLARRWVPRGWAWVAGLLWALSPVARRMYPTVMSQSTSTLLWLVCLWVYWRTLDGDAKRWWLLLGVTWAALWLVRPFGCLLLTLPIGLHVLERMTVPHLRWAIVRRAALAAVVMAGGVGLLLAYDHAVTGQWLETPWTRYAKLYTPMDRLGFDAEDHGGWRPRAATDRSGLDYARSMMRWKLAHRQPLAAWRLQDRLRWVLGGAFDVVLLVTFVPWAFLHRPRTQLAVMAGSVVCVLLGYLFFHFRATPYYYAEIGPLFLLLAIVGLCRWQDRGGDMRHATGVALVVGAIACGLLSGLPDGLREARIETAYRAWFADALAHSVPGRAVVLVRHARNHHFSDCVIDNAPDLSGRVVVGLDRGPDNARLRAMFPDRRFYVVAESDQVGLPGRLIRLDDDVPASPPGTQETHSTSDGS